MGESDEVVDDLVAWAKATDAVRAAVLTGSRAISGREIDAFSDYDVALFLRDPSELEADEGWFRQLGPVLVALSDAYEAAGLEVSSRLVQYRDGTKIDFSLFPLAWLDRVAREGRLPAGFDAGYRVLVDKDGLCTRLPESSGRPVRTAPPDADRYHELVNEFWWETLYVAKFLARGDMLPARYSAECVMRYRCLVPMLEWDLARDAAPGATLGPHGRGVAPLLDPEDRRLLERSFAMSTSEEGWRSLFAAADLFERVSRRVGEALGHTYPGDTARSVRARLDEIRESASGEIEGGEGIGVLAPAPVLRTRRLLLRPLRDSDAPRLKELAGDREVARNTASIPHPYPEGAAEAWIAAQREDDARVVFAIVDGETDELVGGIGLHLNAEHERGELGYWIDRDHWGRGYATEAATAVVRYGFEALGLEKIYAETFVRNSASRRVLEKVGMRREGVLRSHVSKWDEFVDVEAWGILLDDWLEDEGRRGSEVEGGRNDGR